MLFKTWSRCLQRDDTLMRQNFDPIWSTTRRFLNSTFFLMFENVETRPFVLEILHLAQLPSYRLVCHLNHISRNVIPVFNIT